ncbi:MAG: hypothetical protein LBU55_04070 [Elusimicrobiota bacterium]|jgi:Tfp pilus assembly protein PilE|nr:hypothetical protein [Elusimicrobiota bacterium]
MKSNNGFLLGEFLIVLIILIVLSIVAVPVYKSHIKQMKLLQTEQKIVDTPKLEQENYLPANADDDSDKPKNVYETSETANKLE